MAKAEVVVEGGDVVGAEVDMETTKEDMATTRVDMETTRVDMATTKADLATTKAGLVTATKVDLATTIKIMVGSQTGVEEVGEAEVGHIVFQSIMAGKEKPKIITDKNQMRTWTRSMRSQGKTIALVPTMGFLHDGHLSLVQEAQKHAQLVVVSIYVNPAQFAPSEDLSTYPSDFDGDIRKLAAVPGGIDVVFHPHNLYDYGLESDLDRGANGGGFGGRAADSCLEESGSEHETWVRVERLEKGMCGRSRPVFFRGVATIVTKLFNVVEPDVAVFGKKDYQQWRVIRRMVRDLDFSINIVGSEIMRDTDGLAMSSRNVRLSPEERQKALSINRSLSKTKSAAERGELSCKRLKNLVVEEIEEAGGRLDYAEKFRLSN